MKIEIVINDEKQAQHFLAWIKYRGDILLGDKLDVLNSVRRDDVVEPEQVYIESGNSVS